MTGVLFSYGSNMSSGRLTKRIGNIRQIGIARLEKWEMVFNKRGFLDGTAKANIKNHSKGHVYGVLFEIKKDGFLILDRYEMGYKRKEILVSRIGGGQIVAETYISEFTHDFIKPSPEYLAHVIEGAREHQLPICYINELHRTETH